MRRKNILLFIGVALLMSLVGCSETNKNQDNISTEVTQDVKETENVPDVSKVKGICELATLKCYYHNVAKSKKEAGTGLTHAFEKDRTFWIEYTGVVEITYDTSKIQMEQDGTDIKISLPKPTVECTVDPDSWNEDSYIVVNDQWVQKNPITAKDQTTAIHNANEAMKADVENNSSLMSTAEMQAKTLIENYINQIGVATGVTYNIAWETEGVDDLKENTGEE